MALRKEQVLVLLTVVVGALVWKASADAGWRAPVVRAGEAKYEPQAVPSAPLVRGAAEAATQRRWFHEPSETQPLPPTELPLPDRAPLFLVALPLDPGPDLARADLLRIPGDAVQGVVLDAEEPVASGDNVPGEVATAPAHETREQKKERYRSQYDQIWIQGRNEEHFGVLHVPAGVDPYDLETRDNNLQGVTVRLLEFSLDKEKLLPPEQSFGDARQPLIKVRLADTLKNEVARHVRAVPEDAAHVQERLRLIDWLLVQGRREAWVYDTAMAQAAVLDRTAAGLVAAQAKARVLSNKGDLAAELELYRGLEGDTTMAAFRHGRLGILEARLGLWSPAEADLRKAVQLAPTDARPHAALAAFLRERSRPQEAYELAIRADGMLGAVTDGGDRERVIAAIIACRLGTGDVDGARETLFKLRSPDTAGLLPFLQGSIDYAAGKVQQAQVAFRNAATLGYGPPAQLGIAAANLRLGNWAEAARGFEAVVDDAPLLRHRALCGLSLLHLRIGQADGAATFADRALEASPLDAYAHYLRACALRAQGQAGQALEALMAVLKLRDDFVPALAEVVELRLQLAGEASDAVEQAGHALAAMRYADRAVQLSAVPLVPLYELQALSHFRAADLRGAQEGFTRARDAATDEQDRLFAQAGLCVVDYRRDRVDDARLPLERMQSDLPRDNPMRTWAHDTLVRIDDHAQKEMLEDRFERPELGTVWQSDGAPPAESQNGQLVFKGQFTRNGEATATRAGAVQKGGKFLAVATTLELGAGSQTPNTWTGLRIRTQGSGADFIAQVGLRDGRPSFRLVEGRNEPVQAPPDGPRAGAGPHRLELRVLDRGDNQFRLLMLFDDAVLHEQDLTMLRAVDQKELETVLFVEARTGTTVDVRFDDYRLERRKD